MGSYSEGVQRKLIRRGVPNEHQRKLQFICQILALLIALLSKDYVPRWKFNIQGKGQLDEDWD